MYVHVYGKRVRVRIKSGFMIRSIFGGADVFSVYNIIQGDTRSRLTRLV